MNSTICRWAVIAGVTAGSSGCLLAAAGAGAGGAIYVTDRGVESVVAQPVRRRRSLSDRMLQIFPLH